MKTFSGTVFSRLLANMIGYSAAAFFKYLCGTRILASPQIGHGPCILVANHSSHLDWILLSYHFRKRLKRNLVFLAKKELFESEKWKPLMEYSNAIALDRNQPGPQAIRSCLGVLKNGGILGIFPEGTRSEDGNLLKGQEGFVYLWQKSGVPVIPVGLSGFHRILPRGKRFPRISRCSVRIGDPIHLYDIPEEHREDYSYLTTHVMKDIARLSGQQYAHG